MPLRAASRVLVTRRGLNWRRGRICGQWLFSCALSQHNWIKCEKGPLAVADLEEHLRCHHVNGHPGGTRHGDQLHRSGPLQVPLLVRSGPHRTRRYCHDGGDVRGDLNPRPLSLRGGHRHLPQPHLVGVLVRRQHRRAARGAGGRRGSDQAEEPRTGGDGQDRVPAYLQQPQGHFQEKQAVVTTGAHGEQQAFGHRRRPAHKLQRPDVLLVQVKDARTEPSAECK